MRKSKKPNKKVKATKEITIITARKHYSGAELISASEDSETIEVTPFEGPVGHVSVGTSYTKNLGDYSSVKLSVMVTVPCVVEELDDAHEFAAAKTKEYLETHLEEVQASIPETSDDVDDDDDIDDEGAVEDSDDDDLSPDDINDMDKKELDELIDEHELDISKRLGLKKKRAAIIELLEEDDDDDDSDDDIDADDDVDDDDADVEDSDDDADEDDDDDIDDADEDDDDADEAYTKEELEAYSEKDLKEIFKTWELGSYPKGKPKTRKAKAIKIIMEAEEDD